MLDMSTLTERLREVMATNGWEHGDLVRVSGESSSVVSQWLGKGSKEIKRLGRVSTACRIAAASGFAAPWIAEGVGPKRSYVPPVTMHVTEPAPRYLPRSWLDELGDALAALDPSYREAMATNLAGWAREGGASHWRATVEALANRPGPDKQLLTG